MHVMRCRQYDRINVMALNQRLRRGFHRDVKIARQPGRAPPASDRDQLYAGGAFRGLGMGRSHEAGTDDAHANRFHDPCPAARVSSKSFHGWRGTRGRISGLAGKGGQYPFSTASTEPATKSRKLAIESSE